jgi:hypothetical protein
MYFGFDEWGNGIWGEIFFSTFSAHFTGWD